MGLPPPPVASAGKASARARLVVARAGATPARTGTVAALRPSSLPFAAAADRFAGGVRGGGERGGARLAGAAVYPALSRPAAPAFKMSPSFPSYGGAAVLCLARRADGEGHGDGGAGAGGDDFNAKKDCALNHGKGTEVVPAGGGGSGDDCSKKDCAFDPGKRTGGAPAGGDTGVAGAGGDRRNAEKACTFTKVPDAAAAGGGGASDHANHACWERLSLRWALIQGVVTVLLIGFSVYVAFRLWFDTMVRKVAVKYLKDEELRMLVSEAVEGIFYRATEPLNPEAVEGIFYRATEPLNPVLQWKKLSPTNKFYVYCGVLSVCLYFLP